MCLHTIILDPSDASRMYAAISAAGAFRSDDAGESWRPINRGLRSEGIPDQAAEVGHCVHRIAMHPARPEVLFMQKHWDVMRSDDAGESWQEISGNLPTDFEFPIAIHAHEPDTLYVVPITSDSHHFGSDWVSYVVIGAARRAATTDGTDLCFDQNTEKGTSRRGPLFWVVCPAVSYSPTPWPVQYHRR